MTALLLFLRTWQRQSPRFFDLLACLAIAAPIILIYLQVGAHTFVPWDDQLYVFANRWTLQGLTPETFVWAWTNLDAVNFHPLTWLTHLSDVSLFQGDAGMHALHNVVWHVLASLLAFFAIRRWFGSGSLAFLFAFVFAVHPANVESVAWISQRKSVMSAVFWFLTIWAYARYVEKPELKRYLLIIVLFWTGLLCKAAGVTLPFVMLLVDLFWHQRARVPWIGREAPSIRGYFVSADFRRLLGLVAEKLPLFFLSAVVSVLTFVAQRDGGAMPTTDQLPLIHRLASVSRGYTAYLWMFLAPGRLSGMYEHILPLFREMMLYSSALICITLLFLRVHRDRPILIIGWLWFLGTLVPMIGLVQVGSQAYADRYMYLSMGGLCLCLWGLAQWLVQSREARVLVIGGALTLWAGYLCLAAYIQVPAWKSGLTFFTNALAASGRYRYTIINTASQLHSAGFLDDAIKLLTPASKDKAEARASMGLVKLSKGDRAEGLKDLDSAIEMESVMDELAPTVLIAIANEYMAEHRYTDTINLSRRVLHSTNGALSWNLLTETLRKQATMLYISALELRKADPASDRSPSNKMQIKPKGTSESSATTAIFRIENPEKPEKRY